MGTSAFVDWKCVAVLGLSSAICPRHDQCFENELSRPLPAKFQTAVPLAIGWQHHEGLGRYTVYGSNQKTSEAGQRCCQDA